MHTRVTGPPDQTGNRFRTQSKKITNFSNWVAASQSVMLMKPSERRSIFRGIGSADPTTPLNTVPNGTLSLSKRSRFGAFMTLGRPFDKLRERLRVPGQW